MIKTKTKRLLAATIDLVILPMVVGGTIGILLAVNDVDNKTRTEILQNINFFYYLIFCRDFVYSPGRHLFKLDLIDSKTKSKICFYKNNVFLNLWKSLLRNIGLVIPFVLVIGYFVEIIMVISKGHRLADTWAGVEVVEKHSSSV